MRQLLWFLLSVVFAISVNSVAFSQSHSANSIPLHFQSQGTPTPASSDAANDAAIAPITGRAYWGFDLGITNSTYMGNQNFFWHLEDPTFVDPATENPANDVHAYVPFESFGTGLGFLIGGKVAFPLSSSLDLEGKLRYLTNYTSQSSSQDVVLAVDPSTQQATVTSGASNSYSLRLTNLSFAALLNLRLSDQIYGIGGLEYSSLLGNSVTIHQDLANGATYYYSGTGDRSNSGSIDHPASSESSYFTSSRAALQLGAGTAFAISKGSSTMIDAELLLSFPLTSWLTSTGQDNLNAAAAGFFLPAVTYPKLLYASLTVGIRFPFPSGSASTETTSSSEVTPAATEAPSKIGDDGKVALQGRVADAKTGDPVSADITVIDLTNNESVATGHTDPDGKYNVRVRAPGKYSVTAESNGYLFGTAYFEVDNQGRILSSHPDIKLSKAQGGRTRLLVFFDFGKSDLSGSSYPELDRAVRLMKAVPTMKVEIAGYTDSIGSVEYNRDLSERRANAVRTYLTKKGIPGTRVVAKGYGEQSPIADNSTEAGRAENRRVEFVVLND